MSKSNSTNERGATMVEFAVILPLLLVMFFGIVELGRALLFKQRLEQAVEAGARYAARAFGALDVTVCTTLPAAVVDDTRQVVIYGQLTGGVNPVIPGLDSGTVNVEPTINVVTGVGDVCVIRVSATVQYQGIFGAKIPMLGFDQPILGAASEERYVGE